MSGMDRPSAAQLETFLHIVLHILCVFLRLSLGRLPVPDIFPSSLQSRDAIVRYAAKSREPGHFEDRLLSGTSTGSDAFQMEDVAEG